jgi:hypothetical protein
MLAGRMDALTLQDRGCSIKKQNGLPLVSHTLLTDAHILFLEV